jgi:hypothetical protein
MILLLSHLAAAACPATAADIDRAVGDAEAAYAGMDLDGFRAAVSTATADAGCLAERPPRATVASLHRAVGLAEFFVAKDAARAAGAFASARALEPAYTFPDRLVPKGHPLLKAYASQDPAASELEILPPSATGHIEVDTQPSATRPMDRPVLIQVVAEDGSVAAGVYAWPGDPLPGYASRQAPIAAKETRPARPGTLPARARKGPNLPLAGGAVAALALAGASYGVAYSTHEQYYDPSTDASDRPGLRDATNALFVTSVGVGVVAVGLGVGAVVAGSW